MTPDEYVVAKAAITAAVAAYVQRYVSLFLKAPLTPVDWLRLLQVLFPEIQRRYAEHADLARRFYDSQREQALPELPRNERFLTELKWEWFVKDMEPARKELSQVDSPPSAATRFTLTAVREVEMAGRRQIIGAVNYDHDLAEYIESGDPDDDVPEYEKEDQRLGRHLTLVEEVEEKLREPDDPGPRFLDEDEPEYKLESRIVRGWARVATGSETCAWCLMLISRGAVYTGPGTAGVRLDEETVVDLWEESGADLEKFKEQTQPYMEQWHVGCDCIVVPVFSFENWVGKAAYHRANELWIDASKEASRLIESGESRTGDRYKETLNALRRGLAAGKYDVPSYALAA